MKTLYLRFMYFAELWGSPDPWSPVAGATIDAAFAWSLAGAMADNHEELCQWESVK